MSSYFDKKEKQMDRDNKPSWRELDAKKKGNSPYSSSDDASKKFKSQQEKQKQSQSKKALDELFKPKKNSEQNKDWQAVSKARGRDFQNTATQFIEKHGLPKVWDDLLTLLELEDENLFRDVLKQLATLREEQNTGAKTLACAKLRMAKLNQEDPELHDEIDQLINHLS